MDYGTLKKLAVSMGEDFRVIDNVTLEAINVQRLITKEKEYCSTLESLLKSSDEEISSLENETSNTKSKLDSIINQGSLLKSSLESLKSSHTMVELLKGDLLKQLKLEIIKTTEQSIKFDSTLRKYEEIWENYKVIYQKFPLVFDLNKRQVKLKLETIQLSILKKEAKDYQNKISEFISIQDKKEKQMLLNVAEKYIIREKLKKERDDLENTIRLRRGDLEMKNLKGSRLPSYEPNSSLVRSNFENDMLVSDTLSDLMDNFLTELSKDNLSFVAEKSRSTDGKHGNILHSEATLNRGISDPVLKLLPLPVFDSPPRKIRSVGNLLSPPKEWCSRESTGNVEVISLPLAEVGSNNLPMCVARDAGNIVVAEEEATDATEMDVDYVESDPSNVCAVMQVSGNKANAEESQREVVMETEVSEVIEKGKEANPQFEELEDGHTENEDINAPAQNPMENMAGQNNIIEKPVFPSDSPEFKYEPRTKKTAKMEEGSTLETTSPYFVESSYLNFMDVPKNIAKNFNKETTTKQKDGNFDGEVKEGIPVIDLVENVAEMDGIQNDKSNVLKVESKIRKGYPIMHDMDFESSSHTPNESNTTVVDEGMAHNNDSSNKSITINQQMPTHNDYITAKQPECNPKYKKERIHENAAEVFSPQPSDNLNISYGSPMNYSQVSYTDSIDYQDAYQSFSPGACSIDESPQFIPGNQGHSNIFESCAEKSGFNYGFTSTPHQSSASSLFGSINVENNEPKEQKQSEVFNFSFDTKSKTPTMFKLF